MNNLAFIKTLLTLIIVALSNLIGIFYAQADQTNASNMLVTNFDGIYASGEYWKNPPVGWERISVIIHFRAPSTNPAWGVWPKVIKYANGSKTLKDPAKSWMFFLATNSFCGFVELRDKAGNKLHLLKPEVNSQDSYPNTYNLKIMRKLLMGENTYWSGPPVPYALIGSDVPISFYLKDYFKIDEPGEYQLTVWPKIYKRISQTNDLCQRIDLPPVAVTINWSGNSTN